MKIRQAYIQNKHNEVMTTWLEDRPGLKEGAFITLKDFKPDTRWEVIRLYPDAHEANEFSWHRKWDNNI